MSETLPRSLGPLVPGPNYRLLGPSDVRPALKRAVSGFCDDPPVLLRHRSGRGGEPLPVPARLSGAWRGEELHLCPGDPHRAETIGLILDGALAISTGSGPVSGPAAASLLGLAAPDEGGIAGPMRSSLAALRLAAASPVVDIDLLTASLYYFGRRPLGRALRSRTPDASSVASFLGLDRVDRVPEISGRFDPRYLSSAWFYWRAPGAPDGAEHWKLYVCIALDALVKHLPAIATALADGGAQAFKVAGNAHGLCRPDRLIGYFADEHAMRAAARRIGSLVAGSPVEPLTFAVAIDAEGRTAYGRDPARDSLAALEGRSWRLWLCHHLARALASAREAPSAEWSPACFALLRASVLGLDPATFEPARG